MKHIVQYSGGVGSAMAAYLVAQQVPKKDIILLFHDVRGGHDDDVYRFNADVSRFLEIPISECSDERTIWEVIKENKCLPSIWMPFCTRILKLEMGDKFYNQMPYFVYHQENPEAEELALYPDVQFSLYTGYCKGEEKRVEKAKYPVNYPVFDAGLTSADCKRIIRDEWGIELPRAYQWFEHNNCIPCWKSGSKDYWRKVWEHYPDRYQMAIEMEEYTGHTQFKGVSLTQLAERWGGLNHGATN